MEVQLELFDSKCPLCGGTLMSGFFNDRLCLSEGCLYRIVETQIPYMEFH